MIQNPKGGGLSSSFGGSQQLGGVQKTTDFLDKSTWTLALTLMVLVLFSSLSFNSGSGSDSKILDENAVTIPTVPSAAPAIQNAPARTETPGNETPQPVK